MKEEQGIDTVHRELVAGATGGFIQDIIMHPADTVRARLQVVQTEITGSVAAYQHIVRNTIKREGPMGFYGGFSTVFMFSMPANAVYFTSYSVFKRQYEQLRDERDLPIPDGTLYFAAGFSAEMCASLLFTPFDVVKQRLQVLDSRTNVLGAFGMINKIVRSDGYQGLFRGLVAGWCVWGPFSAVYFATYESLRPHYTRLLHRNEKTSTADEMFLVDLLSGVCAGAFGAAVTQPLDALKTRLQVGRLYDYTYTKSDVYTNSKSSARTATATAAAAKATTGGTTNNSTPSKPKASANVVSVLRQMLREEGVVPLFRGVWGRVLWVAPGTGITVAVFRFVDTLLSEQ